MAKSKLLLGVANDIAAHASSGLSFLFPHLVFTCHASQCMTTSINLLYASPYAANLVECEPLRLALSALQQRFVFILERRGFVRADLIAAELYFTVPEDPLDGSIFGVRSLITTNMRNYGWDLPLPDEMTLARYRLRRPPPIDFTVHRREDLP